ncbi:MAG: SemiSWEET transporter [Candidatus Marsarchaeota archaeon]|nr:SemiSWEET transporter [Candidatus Marsarchaeota archaeon]MCL5413240.1 SemiSWEET transporter [Candidatus Marsarchaeota archaeon]
MDPSIIGIVAGTLTVISFIPQISRVRKNRSARDLSWKWMAGFSAGIFLWVVYGVIYASMPIILSNVVMLALIAALIALKWRYGKQRT